jgi:hypothetical protein
MTPTVRLTVHTGAETHELVVAVGANLRQTLLDAGLSPYVWRSGLAIRASRAR